MAGTMTAMANVALVYGPKGAGKTTTTLRIADLLIAAGVKVGGFFQRTTRDDLDRRGYDLVRVRDRHQQAIPLARPGCGTDESKQAVICSFAFSHEAFETGLRWLREDAQEAEVLVVDEVSKLEVSRQGHAAAIRFALGLPAEKVILLSVRGDQLFYVVETFGLDNAVLGDLELPATEHQISDIVHTIIQRIR